MLEDEFTEIQSKIWQSLAEAVGSQDSAWRIFTLATMGAEQFPQARQVVLRGVNSEARQLHFFTDPRTPKWSQLLEHPRAEALFWNSNEKIQLRCRCRAQSHQNDELSECYRKQVPDHLAGDYAALSVPGTKIECPAAGQDLGKEWSFGVVVLTITAIDWLQLSREGHRRVRFRWQDEEWGAYWVQP